MNKCMFSDLSKKELNSFFNLQQENGVIYNLSIHVKLDITGNLVNTVESTKVHNQHVKDLMESMVKSAEFVANQWVSDCLPEEVSVSGTDLKGAEIFIEGLDSVFYIDFKIEEIK